MSNSDDNASTSSMEKKHASREKHEELASPSQELSLKAQSADGNVDVSAEALATDHSSRSLELPERAPYVGLRNKGATCYVNSAIQALFRTECFQKHLSGLWDIAGTLGIGCLPDEERLVSALGKFFLDMKDQDMIIERSVRENANSSANEKKLVKRKYALDVNPVLGILFQLDNFAKNVQGDVTEFILTIFQATSKLEERMVSRARIMSRDDTITQILDDVLMNVTAPRGFEERPKLQGDCNAVSKFCMSPGSDLAMCNTAQGNSDSQEASKKQALNPPYSMGEMIGTGSGTLVSTHTKQDYGALEGMKDIGIPALGHYMYVTLHAMENINDLFDHQTEQTITCKNCNFKSVVTQENPFLLVNVVGNNSLGEALSKRFSDEEMTGDSKYHCEQCSGRVDAVRSEKISSLPPFLMIQLNVFARYDQNAGVMRKVQQQMDIPFVNPIPADVLRENLRQPHYELYSAIFHIGQTKDAGHYHACVRIGEKWYDFNDDAVTEVLEHVVLWALQNSYESSGTPYVLFYERVDDDFYDDFDIIAAE